MHDNATQLHAGGVHIGVEECKKSFCDSFRDQKCCRHDWSPHSPGFAYSFNIYGDTLAREPTVDVEWVTGPDTHYPTDLGLRLEQPDVNLTRWVGQCWCAHHICDVRCMSSCRINIHGTAYMGMWLSRVKLSLFLPNMYDCVPCRIFILETFHKLLRKNGSFKLWSECQQVTYSAHFQCVSMFDFPVSCFSVHASSIIGFQYNWIL